MTDPQRKKKLQVSWVKAWRARNPERYAEQRFNEKLKRAGMDPAIHNPSYKPAKPFELLRRGVAQKPHKCPNAY